MKKSLNIGVLGIDHGHIFDMLDEMLKEGCTCKFFWTEGSPLTLNEFIKKYPNIKRVEDKEKILDDQEIDIILISSIPVDRAKLAIHCLNAGKDVMVDKPGCTTIDQLNELKKTVKKTGKIWSVNFSERFHVSAVTKAEELISNGLIGTVKQTIGTGPHRQGNYEDLNGFMKERVMVELLQNRITSNSSIFIFTGSNEAKINHALVEILKKEFPGFQDFGEINLTSNKGHGYIRLDWFTPDALPTWGDGRLLILGDKGYLEIRKYTDIARSKKGNHLFYANNNEVKYIDCSEVGLPYFRNLINDVLDRTETACLQELTFLSMELAIKAQEFARKK